MRRNSKSKQTRMVAPLVGAALTVTTLAGCGDSPENRLQRADLARQQQQYEQAIEHSTAVLVELPGNEKALTIKAESEVRLGRYDLGEKTVAELLKLDGTSLRAHELQMDVVFGRLGKLIEQSTFVSDASMQEQFVQLVEQGREQVKWFDTQEGQKSEAALYRARLSMAEAQRLAREVDEAGKRLENLAANSTGGQGKTRVDKLKEDLAIKNRESLDYLWASIVADPSETIPSRMFAGLAGRINAHADLWRLAELLSQQEQLSAVVVNDVMDRLLEMPESYQPIARRAQIGQTMLDRVPEAQRKTRPWQMSQAHVFVLQNKLDEAEPLLDAMIKANPRDVQGRYLLSRLYHVRNHGDDMENARKILDVLATEQRNNPMVVGLHGMVLAELGDNALASEQLRQARAMAPDNMLINAAWIRHKADTNDLLAAREAVEQQYRANPTDPNAIAFKLRFEKADSNEKGVAALLEDVARITPRLDTHLPLMIDAAEYLKRYPEAAAYAEEFAQRQPNLLPAQLKLVETKLRMGQDAEATEMLTKLKTRFPDAPDIDITLGKMYLGQRAYDRSADILEKVIEKQPDNLEARLLLARSLVSMALVEQSLEQVNFVIEKDPRSVEARELASRIYQLLGDEPRAQEQLLMIDSKMVDPNVSPLAAAALKLRGGDLDEAARIAERALRQGNSSNDAMLRLLLAQVYGRQGNFNQAEFQLVALVKAWPDNPQAYKLLAKYYLERGQAASGVTVFRGLRAINDPLSRLSESALYLSMSQPREAMEVLAPAFKDTLQNKDRVALALGDAMASIYQSGRDYESAEKIYAALESIPEVRYTATYKRIGATSRRQGLDETVKQLKELVDTLPPEQSELRYAIARDFANYRRHDLALELIDRWIDERPDSVTLLLWKGELLTEMDRLDEAQVVLNQAIERKAGDPTLYTKLAQTQLAGFDYPAAEETYQRLREVDVTSRMLSLAAEGELFLSIGLDAEAVRAFADLESVARPSDPRVIYATGRAYAAMNRNDEAIARLMEVPAVAKEYVPAQLLITRLDQRDGRTDEARKRLTALMREQRGAQDAAGELLKLNIHDRRHEELLQWSDMVLQMDRLPAQMRVQWLWMRAAVASDRADWQAALSAVDDIATIVTGDPRVDSTRILLLWRLARVTEAREILQGNETLSNSQVGPSLAVLLNLDDANTPTRPPLIHFFELLSDGDVDGARSQLATMPQMKAIFKSDLQTVLNRPDVNSPEMIVNFQAMIGATIASGLNADALAEDVTSGVISRAPMLMAAHALNAQSIMDMGRPLDPVLRKVRAAGDSSLALLLQAQDASGKKQHAEAVAALEKLRDREPGNEHVDYMLAQQYQMVKDVDKSIAILEKLAGTDGSYRAVAENDLAYLLAEHKKDRLDEAYAMAARALEIAPLDPRLLDTIGWIEHLRGNNEVALGHMQRAIAGLPSRPELHYHIGLTYKALGNDVWARRHLEQAARGDAEVREVELAKAALAG